MRTKQVVVVPYDVAWKYAFEEIKSQIGDMVMKDKQQKAYQSKINQLKILYPVDQM